MRSRVALGCASIALVLGCGGSVHAVHIGETRDEFGSERACGSRGAKRIAGQVGDRAASSTAFEKRLGAARMTAESLACAARAAVSPALLPLAEEADARSPLRCEAEAQCYDGFHVTGDAEADVAALADRCGRACGMTARTEPEEGVSSEDAPPRVYALDLDPARCYRLFAVGDPGVRVLAAALTDRAGNVVSIDNSRDRAPILGPRSAFCPRLGGEHRLVVSAVRGEGRYVVQVWSRPRHEEEDR